MDRWINEWMFGKMQKPQPNSTDMHTTQCAIFSIELLLSIVVVVGSCYKRGYGVKERGLIKGLIKRHQCIAKSNSSGTRHWPRFRKKMRNKAFVPRQSSHRRQPNNHLHVPHIATRSPTALLNPSWERERERETTGGGGDYCFVAFILAAASVVVVSDQ